LPTNLTKRATPQQYSNFKLGKVLVSICTNCEPFSHLHELLTNSSIRQEDHYPLAFTTQADPRLVAKAFPIAYQQLPNNLISNGFNLSQKMALDFNLKKSFFTRDILEKNLWSLFSNSPVYIRQSRSLDLVVYPPGGAHCVK